MFSSYRGGSPSSRAALLGVLSKSLTDKFLKFDDIRDVSRLICDTVSRSDICVRVKNIDHGRGKRCCVGRWWGTQLRGILTGSQ